MDASATEKPARRLLELGYAAEWVRKIATWLEELAEKEDGESRLVSGLQDGNWENPVEYLDRLQSILRIAEVINSPFVPLLTRTHHAWLFRIYPEWKRAFIKELGQSATANRAWGRIKSKPGLNLDLVAEVILYLAARWSDYAIEHIQKGFALQASNLKAAQRAEREAKKRLGDKKAERFEQKRVEHFRQLAMTPWPFPNSKAKTLYDAVSVTPLDVGNKKIADALRRWGPRKLMLAMLRAGMHSHGVELSPLDLSVLAFCADTDWKVDERTLRRFFQEPMLKEAEAGFIKSFQSLLNTTESLLAFPNLPRVTTTP